MLPTRDNHPRCHPALVTGLWLLCVLMCTACAQGGDMDPDASAMGDTGATEAGLEDGGDLDSSMSADAMDGTVPDGDLMDARLPDATADAGPMEAGPTDASPPDATGPPCTVAPGFVYVTEIMIASVSGSRDRGEWFELYNPGDCEADLSGFIIASPTASGTSREHTITSLRIAPRSFVSLGQSLNPAEHHGAGIDYAYGTGASTTEVRFSNDRDSLTLRSGTLEIDSIAWTSSGFSYSTSRQFPTGGSADVRGVWSHWCDSTRVFSMMGGMFYGTPGAANDMACP